MITVPVIAFILLVTRLTSVVFIVLVLIRQIKLFKLPIESHLVSFRMAMFSLNLVTLVGSIIPIYADFYYAFIHQGSGEINIIVAYAVSNALVYLAGSVLVWKIYMIASKEIEEKEDTDGSRGNR